MTLHAIASESSCTCNTRFNQSTCQIAGSNMWLEDQMLTKGHQNQVQKTICMNTFKYFSKKSSSSINV